MDTFTIKPDSLNFTICSANNDNIEYHAHDYVEFLVLRSGSVNHIIENIKDTFIQGDILLITPGIAHAYTTPQNSSTHSLLVRTTFFEDVCNYYLPDLYRKIIKNRYIKFHISLHDLEALENHIMKWHETIDIDTKKAYEKIIVTVLISFILTMDLSDKDKSSFRDACLKAVNQYYSLPDALDKIRNELGYNEIYFCRKFKQCFNCTLVDYVNNLRLNYAAYLIKTTKVSISECVSQIGLGSLPYFIKLFKQKYGVTPSQYKKENQRSKK